MVQLAVPVFRLMRACLFIAVPASFLAACALKPAPTQPEILQQALPPATRVPAAWEADPPAAAVADNWIKLFNDPALEAVVAEAMAYNLDLRQAAERVRIAQQNVVRAGARLLPQVDGLASASSLRDFDRDSTESSTVLYANVGWELDVWGRLRSERSAAQAGYEATALEYAYARQSLAATVARNWYLAIEARQLLELNEESVKVFEQLLRLVQIRRASGKDSDLDVVNVEAQLESARSDLAAATELLGVAQRNLEVLLGRYPAAEIEVASTYPQLPEPATAGIPAALLERRPDIVAAERAVVAAFRLAEAARLALLPGFSFSLSGGRLGDELLTLLQLNPWLATASIGMSIPIYEGGKLRAEVEIASARQSQAVAHYGSVALNAFYEVENALANEKLLAKRIPMEQRVLEYRTQAVEIATVQYQAGRRDLLWVSQLQAEEIAAAASVIQLRSSQGANRIRLYLALGGSFDSAPTASLPVAR